MTFCLVSLDVESSLTNSGHMIRKIIQVCRKYGKHKEVTVNQK